MNILIIGSNGASNALGWKLCQSPKVSKIFFAPGNAGTAALGENVGISATDLDALVSFALRKKIGLTVVGEPEALALGIAKKFQKKKLDIWGPSQAAAQIESSKAYAKNLMQHCGVPTARFQTFSNYTYALQYLENIGAPVVIKTSGLALSRGVKICKTLSEARLALKQIMVDRLFGDAGSLVVIEELLHGREFAMQAFCDGKTFKLLPAVQEYKSLYNSGKGPNTAGLGAVAPLPWVNEETANEVCGNIIAPILKGLKKDGAGFSGLLCPGLMQTEEGPKALEFNARFGDPEAQVLMRLLKSDLLDILQASIRGKLEEVNIEWSQGIACCVVLCDKDNFGPTDCGQKDKSDKTITGLKQAGKTRDVVIFHGDTKRQNNRLLACGHRILHVTATGATLKEAVNKAYAAAKKIRFPGMRFRTDIGE